MNHAGEGLLQAYVDGELTAEEKSSLAAHLGTCAVCEAELDGLRAAGAVVHEALSLLDAPVPLARAREAFAGRAEIRPPASQIEFPIRRRGAFGITAASGGLARAAALVLLVAGSAAAVIPGSPLRRWLEQGIDRIAAVITGRTETPAVVTTAPAPVPPVEETFVPGAEMSVAPSGGAVRIAVQATGGELRVFLVDAAAVSVQTDSSAHDASFRSGRGRLDVLNAGESVVVIRLPRSVMRATIEVNGSPYLTKDGDQLRTEGPLIRRSSDEIVFRTGS
ncbi:MAG TPA: zf-HC2 domain-containing protein [Longimicrobiales bacterium]